MISDRNTKNEILAQYQELMKKAGAMNIRVEPETAGLNARSTKAELLEACKKVERLLGRSQAGNKKDQTGQLSVPVDKEAVRGAEIDVPASKPETSGTYKPVNEKVGITEESLIISEEDGELKLLNDEIINKIHSLEEAKALRIKERQSINTLETELEKFISMLNVNREKLTEQKHLIEEKLKEADEKKNEEVLTAKRDADERIEKAKKELSEVKAAIKERINNRDAERIKEKEQYDYDLSVRYKKEDDAWSDELLKREAALKLMESDIKGLKEQLSGMEALVPEYMEKLEKLPSILEAAKEEGAKKREKEIKEEYSHKTEIAKKDADARVMRLERQIEVLKEDYASLLAEKNSIQTKLDRAYDESNKLYLQTIQSTGGIKILGALDNKNR